MLFKEIFFTEEKLTNKLKRMGFELSKANIHKDETVDYDGDVNLSKKQLSVIPIKFGVVRGNFDVSDNALRNLVNAPKQVYGNFTIDDNFITDVKDSPKLVLGDYSCKYNKLDDINKKDIEKVCKVRGKIYVD